MDRPYEPGFRTRVSGKGWELDDRHVFLLNSLLRLRRWKRTLEIGSLYGYSTTAFMELPPGQLGEINICDVLITNELGKLVAGASTPVKIYQKDSLQVLTNEGYFDFVYVDGDHSYNHVTQETELLLKMKPTVITAHDTSLQHKWPDSDNKGPMALKLLVSIDPAYYTIEDNYDRPDERTWRGFFFATTDFEVFQEAKRAFHRWTQP